MTSIRRLLEEIDEERLRAGLIHFSRDPLPYRRRNSILPEHTRSTLEEADAWFEAQLQSWGYRAEREGCPVRAFGYDPEKPLLPGGHAFTSRAATGGLAADGARTAGSRRGRRETTVRGQTEGRGACETPLLCIQRSEHEASTAETSAGLALTLHLHRWQVPT